MLRHYLVWTWRTLAADRLTTLLNLLALSLGLVSFALAVATVLFLRSNDASLPNAERIYAVTMQVLGPAGTTVASTVPMSVRPVAKYMQAEYPEIEAITQTTGAPGPQQAVVAGKSRMLMPAYFDETFTKVLKLPLRYGDPDQAFSQPRSVILLAEAAQRLFGDVNPVGQPMRIGGVDVTITGVLAPLPAPSLFRPNAIAGLDLMASPDVRDLITPAMPEPDVWDNADSTTFILLPPGQSVDELRAKMADFGPRHVQRLQRTYKFGLIPLTDAWKVWADAFLSADKTGISVTTLLIGLGGLVLFVASLNYANLTAAKAIGRLPESGMKKVLGAGRLSLVAQYLTESLALAGAALLLVLLVLALIAGPFVRLTGIDLPRLLFHRPAFWLMLSAGVAAATLCGGFYPAWLLSGPRAMAATLGGKVRPGRSRLASMLVGLQFLTASFLLIMVGVVALQNGALHRQVTSTDGTHLLVIDTSLEKQDVTPEQVRDALRDIPGVETVAGVSMAPWAMGADQHRFFKDPDVKNADVKGQAVTETDLEVSQEYFAALGSHLLAGRFLSPERGGDLRPDDPVPTVAFNVVVDRAFALAFGWTPEQAIGQNVWHYTLTGGSAPIQIVGVIENQPQNILSYGSTGSVYNLHPGHALVPILRLAAGAGPDTLAAIDRALVRLNPTIEWRRHFSDELLDHSAAMLTSLLAAMGGLTLFAVIIALLGLAGMAVHTLHSRTEEIGIRKILGADHIVILRLLSWDLTKPVLIAALAAWPLGYLGGQVYLSLFTGRITLGPWPFLASLAATLGVAWLAVGWRIASASAKSPAEVLRYE